VGFRVLGPRQWAAAASAPWGRRSAGGRHEGDLAARACEPNKQMQPTGRSAPSSARALIAAGDQWNEGLCGRHHEGLQLICIPLGGRLQIPGGLS